MQSAIALNIVLLVLVVVFTQTEAQRRPRCPGEPANYLCLRPLNVGYGGGNCQRNSGTRWYYNTAQRRCMTMFYRGCGGNENRYCSSRDCENYCI